MSILTRYVGRLFLGYLAGVLFGFVALLQTFDLLKSADDVMARHGETLSALVHYAVLRLPEAAAFLLPLCVLIAALLTLARLSQSNEIVALKAAGVPVWRLLAAFAPATVVAAVLQFALSDQLSPRAQAALERWDESAEAVAGTSPLDGDGVWLHDDGTVAHVRAVRGEGARLYGLTLYLRDAAGNLTERVQALTANYTDEGTWLLGGVKRTTWQGSLTPQVEPVADTTWPIALRPDQLEALTILAGGLSLRQLFNFSANPGLGEHPRHYYQTWLNKRIAAPFAAFLMILLAAPMARTIGRTGGVLGNFGIALGLGLLYLITDGIVFTLGEAGAFPPVLAAWVPIWLFACIGGAVLVHMDG